MRIYYVVWLYGFYFVIFGVYYSFLCADLFMNLVSKMCLMTKLDRRLSTFGK